MGRDKASAGTTRAPIFKKATKSRARAFTSDRLPADINVTRHEHHRPSRLPPDMNRRPLATQHIASDSPATETNASAEHTGGAADKKWQIDEASGVPAPVIRANMISFRRSYRGRVKVTFFDQD